MALIGLLCGTEDRFFTLSRMCVEAVSGYKNVDIVGIPFTHSTEAKKLSKYFDGFILPGGWDIDPVYFNEECIPETNLIQPERDKFETAVAGHAVIAKIPILAICRGMQVLNIALGGDIYQDIYTQTSTRIKHMQDAPRWYATHWIKIEKGSRLNTIVGTKCCRVNTYHHQAIRCPGQGVSIAARSNDGLIEAIDVDNHPFALGVQWHPEDMVNTDSRQNALFTAFVNEVVNYRRSRSHSFSSEI